MVPFVDAYYKLGESQSAQKLASRISFKYRDELEYFSSLTVNEQYMMGENVITEIERYRTMVEAILVNEDEVLLKTNWIYL